MYDRKVRPTFFNIHIVSVFLLNQSINIVFVITEYVKEANGARADHIREWHVVIV